LKTNPKQIARSALNELAAAAALTALLCGVAQPAWSLGLGRLVVQSSLGESLRAEVDVTSITPDEANNLRVRVAPPDSYRVAGIDYNPVLTATAVSLQKRADGSNYLQIVSDRVVQEPAVDVILEMSWTTGRLMREYTLLFDPPVAMAQSAATPSVANLQPTLPIDPVAAALAAAVPAMPAASADVVQAAASAPAVAEEKAPELQMPASAPEVAPVDNGLRMPAPEMAPLSPVNAGTGALPVAVSPVAPAEVTQPANVATQPKSKPEVVPAVPTEYRVKRGDSLTAIAQRNMLSGVSLEQMLVGLFRGNAPAFVAGNMNRLKSGVLISIPEQGQVAAIDPAQARQLIHVQSADFNAYRQRLAAAVPAPVEADTSRQATSTGKVQTEVQDRRQAAVSTTDRLTIDKKAAAGKGDAVPLTQEDKIAAERAQRDAADRKGELRRNLEELKKLQAASSSTGVGASSAVDATASATRGGPLLPGKAASEIAVASTVSGSAVDKVAASASAPASGASVGGVLASSPKSAASGASSAASNGVARPAIPAASAAPDTSEPSLLDTLSDNPYVLPGAGLVLALLAGLGYYRLRGKGKDEAGVSSFLESRLQPDSFFGASGGQRVDTRDAAAAPSSMSYSLSQIDAIGDVDPVAEADVYLAYGRDLQAEEILKEALRSSPDRLAIRSKLLEVYAKRRDVKGFESMAGELYGLTDGHGEEWAKAQELGRSIDPENPLYEPGGHPQGGSGGMGTGEPLGATTMPQSVVPSSSRFQQGSPVSSRGMPSAQDDVSIDLDISVPSEIGDGDDFMSPRSAPSVSAPANSGFGARKGPDVSPTHAGSGSSIDFNADDFSLPKMPSVEPVSLHDDSHSLDFGAVSLDFDLPPSVSPAKGSGTDDAESDPWLRKIELADEFRQIGDIEGARDMLLEVVEKANPTLKAKAKRMLDSLG
jgi:pilus assembly protein FimV